MLSSKPRGKQDVPGPRTLKSQLILLIIFSILVFIVICLYTLRLEDVWIFTSEKEPACDRPKSIFFLKLHKCAGSSVQNVILRLSEKLNMKVALPVRGNYFGHPAPFRAEMVHRPAGDPNATYQVLAHHLRLDVRNVTQVVGEHAVWLTVMRRPVDQFISMFTYYNLQDVWNVSLEAFAAAPTNVAPPAAAGRHFVPNQMAFDLGFDAQELQENEEQQQQAVEAVGRRFSLVLVADLLDESLVLLRERLCLDWDDVVVFRHNARPPALRPAAERNVTTRRQLRLHLAADTQLYHHFHLQLRQQLRDHGVLRMERDVERLRRRTRYWARRCRGWRFIWPGEPTRLPPVARRGAGYDAWMCSRLFAHELVYTEHVRAHQESGGSDGGTPDAVSVQDREPPPDYVPEAEIWNHLPPLDPTARNKSSTGYGH